MLRDFLSSPRARLLTAPIFLAIVAWHLLWGSAALVIDPTPLIELMNGLVLAVACGVVVAYLPLMREAVFEPRPASAQILTAGIWLAWLAVLENRLWSIAWRSLGQPEWLLDTDFTTHFIALSMLAGLFHLAGPEAINGRVPSREWIRLGVIVGSGALLAFLVAIATR